MSPMNRSPILVLLAPHRVLIEWLRGNSMRVRPALAHLMMGFFDAPKLLLPRCSSDQNEKLYTLPSSLGTWRQHWPPTVTCAPIVLTPLYVLVHEPCS